MVIAAIAPLAPWARLPGRPDNEVTQLQTVDFSRNRRAPQFSEFSVLQVRYGKAQRGSPPKRRSVLTVFDWSPAVLDTWFRNGLPWLAPAVSEIFPRAGGQAGRSMVSSVPLLSRAPGDLAGRSILRAGEIDLAKRLGDGPRRPLTFAQPYDVAGCDVQGASVAEELDAGLPAQDHKDLLVLGINGSARGHFPYADAASRQVLKLANRGAGIPQDNQVRGKRLVLQVETECGCVLG